MSRKSGKRLSKREFLKLSLASAGGLAFAWNSKLGFSGDFGKYKTNDPLELIKTAREAQYYKVLSESKVQCTLCPQECILKSKDRGACRNRINNNGKLFTIAYGNPCAVHVDPIEKKPLYHFLPTSKAFSIATAGCNLACLNCQNWNISQVGPEETKNYDLSPSQVVQNSINYECKSIAYTYSEPIAFYEYAYDTSKIAREKGVMNIFISAGFINEEPLRKISKLLDAANIDLKSFSNETYLKLNAGSLQPVLNTLKVLKEEGVWVEITNLVVPSWTDDLDMIKKMCNWLTDNGLAEAPLHFSRFTPRYKLKHLPQTPVSTLVKAREIALAEGLSYVYIGNVPGSEGENTYCPKCKKILLKRKGFHILENHIKNNCCTFCNNKIAGVWQ